MTNCPGCNSNQIYQEGISHGVLGPWRCADCGWYEGHEIDAAIDAANEVLQKAWADRQAVLDADDRETIQEGVR